MQHFVTCALFLCLTLAVNDCDALLFFWRRVLIRRHVYRVNGGWSQWIISGSCTKRCGGGQQKYQRHCNNPVPRNGGSWCFGNAVMYRPCNLHKCKVNGGWSAWKKVGGCSKKCGGGQQKLIRHCNNPPSSNGGRNCVGKGVTYRPCNTKRCKVNGGWSAWKQVGGCSKRCGGGQQKLIRHCNNPPPSNGGRNCVGKGVTYRPCNTKSCKVNGGWSTWKQVGGCSKRCGGGQQKLIRHCNNPPSSNGGRNCVGKGVTYRPCNTNTCIDQCKCTAMGEPHYKTYDGQWIHFQGICKYVLTQLSDHDDPCWFSVSVKNENRGSKRVSFTRLVDIQLPNTKLRLRKGRKLEVNGVRYYLPYERQEEFRVLRSGSYIRVETSCGIVVTWNGISTVSVMVPVKYGNELRGICGNCNQRKDDFITKDGNDVSRNPNKFNLIGESWRIPDDSGINQCTPPGPPPVCTNRERRLASRNNACGLLNPKNIRSPFRRCILGNAVVAMEFYNNCLYDCCTYYGKSKEELQKVVCNAIEGFAEACKDKGMAIKWRSNTFCPMQCGANQVYNYKTTGCPATCVDPNAPKTCALPKAEGCECIKGYILSDDQCVKTSRCGCYHGGRYLPVGTVIKGCYEELHCKYTGNKARLLVADIRCSNYSECKLANGQYKCVCRDGYIGNGLTCKPKEDCIVSKQLMPNCRVSYQLEGTCRFSSSSAENCKYRVYLKKDKAGKTALATVEINDKPYSFEYRQMIKACATFILQGTALIIQEYGCPHTCRVPTILD